MVEPDRVGRVLEKIRKLAVEYYTLTGKPLGVTSEIGEYLAARHLGLTLMPARQAGFDATDDKRRKVQIKTRRLPPSGGIGSQRIGSIRVTHSWDVLLLVLLDENLELRAIHEARRRKIVEAIGKTQSRARRRGALSIGEVIGLGRRVWPVEALARRAKIGQKVALG